MYADQLNEVLTAKSEQGGFKDLVRGPVALSATSVLETGANHDSCSTASSLNIHYAAMVSAKSS